MEINIKVTQSELDKMNFDRIGLTEHVIETLDQDDKELVGYTVNIEISE
jgi:hypothetical protein